MDTIDVGACQSYWRRRVKIFYPNEALAWQKQTGFKVRHETHRKRFLHSPWVARSFVPKFPQLKMVADLSHWINIAETDSNDPDLVSVIEKFAPQFGHTHCRVGNLKK